VSCDYLNEGASPTRRNAALGHDEVAPVGERLLPDDRPDGQPSDRELADACLRGCTQAWKDLVRRHADLVYTVARRSGLTGAEADEVFHDAWARLWEHLPEMRDGARLKPWLLTTTARLALERRAR
jgi:hypothetical protein